MHLNLNDIVGRPGAKKPFSFSLDLQDMSFFPVSKLEGPFPVTGEVKNAAGALTLSGMIEISMLSACDRCMSSIPVKKELPVLAHLAEELIDLDNPDIFLITDGEIDLADIFTTAFVLHLDSKMICREDCLGLCMACGTNLNDDPCTCAPEPDPRLAALQQLLDVE